MRPDPLPTTDELNPTARYLLLAIGNHVIEGQDLSTVACSDWAIGYIKGLLEDLGVSSRGPSFELHRMPDQYPSLSAPGMSSYTFEVCTNTGHQESYICAWHPEGGASLVHLLASDDEQHCYTRILSLQVDDTPVHMLEKALDQHERTVRERQAIELAALAHSRREINDLTTQAAQAQLSPAPDVGGNPSL